jgi:hypothetical protein
MKQRFILISCWHLDCGLDTAWQRIHAIRNWPRWWPNVRAMARDIGCSLLCYRDYAFTPGCATDSLRNLHWPEHRESTR